MANAASFITIAVVVMLASAITGRLLRQVFRGVGLGWADRLLGAGFGLVQGWVAVTVAVMALTAFLPYVHWLDDSQLAPYFLTFVHQSTALTPAELGERIRGGLKRIHDAQPPWLQDK